MDYITSKDGLKIAYTTDGDPSGLPVLCLAGLTRNHKDFDFVLPYLEGCYVIRMDYRGRGASEWAEDPMSYAIPNETQDAIDLLDHLGVEKAAVLGTSRGGLIAMTIGAMARDRLIGICFNDIGPDIDTSGLAVIKTYIGKRPPAKTFAEYAAMRAKGMPGFANVPESRWLEDAQRSMVETADGLDLTYDPALRAPVLATDTTDLPDLWPFFVSLSGMPLAVVRGANSNILTAETMAEMAKRVPDLIYGDVPDRAHAPFLDEPAAVEIIQKWIAACQSQ